MKQIIFFSSLFVFSLLVSCAETKEETKESIASIEIGLEVMTKDLGLMKWEAAKIACENLGDGWRLPTKEEFILMYINKDKIGGFTNEFYWSSTELDNPGVAWGFCFNNEAAFGFNKGNTCYVRAVRTLK